MVSIIMPINNSAIYLSECLDSIINQSYENWELIAVNNGSKDNSLEIIMAGLIVIGIITIID